MTDAERDARDAERYRKLRALFRSDFIRAQALLWKAEPSRRRLDKLIDNLELQT